jgi:nitroreductase
MELYEVMRTTFAARDFGPEPIPDDTLRRILDHARFAPSGGNRQGWRVLSVHDERKRERIAELMVPAARRYVAQLHAGENPWNSISPTALSDREIDATDSQLEFLRDIAFAPTLLLIFVDLSVVASIDAPLDRVGIVSGASIYPFAWNILLAARNEGYGGTLTTFIALAEVAVKELFGVPDEMAVCALLPMGKPSKQLTRLKRRPVESFAWKDSWEGPPIA